jgi:hypothetical protein
MTPAALDDLIARVERATEGSADLDQEIGLVTGRGYFEPPCLGSYCFTHSVDAALTLVPPNPGWRWLLDKRPYAESGRPDGYRAEVWCSPGIEPAVTASWCKTPALALCAAALKARRS